MLASVKCEKGINRPWPRKKALFKGTHEQIFTLRYFIVPSEAYCETCRSTLFCLVDFAHRYSSLVVSQGRLPIPPSK